MKEQGPTLGADWHDGRCRQQRPATPPVRSDIRPPGQDSGHGVAVTDAPLLSPAAPWALPDLACAARLR